MENPLLTEVEDIMCDQGIITAELNMDIQTSSTVTISATRFRVAVTVIARAVLPAVVGVYYAYLRNQKTVVESVRRQVIPAVFAFLANSVSRSLSSVQRGIYYPLSLRPVPRPAITEDESVPEKCVNCNVLYQPQSDEISADVIFIHGIHGSLVKTWKQGLWYSEKHKVNQVLVERTKQLEDLGGLSKSLKRCISDHCYTPPCKICKTDIGRREVVHSEENDQQEDASYSKCWPKDWLSKDFPGARIIALNYTTDPHLWRPVWVKKKKRSCMVQRSMEMIDHLLQLNVGDHPIVWVGHSKGGLYIKQILVHAWENTSSDLQKLYLQTKAIMFYSVPHKGSYLADFTLPFLKRSVELLEIQRNCRFVLNLHKKFVDMLQNTQFNPEIFSFIETSLTFMSFIYLRIVAVESADPEIGTKWGVPLDHREICKPSSKNCFLYKELVNLIQKTVYNTTL